MKKLLHHLELFNKFILKLDKKPTKFEDRLSLFVGYLVNNRNKSTTIRSYVSTIKLVSADVDVKLMEDSYLLASLMRACKLVNDKIHIRLPIYREMLHIIITDIRHYMAMKGHYYLSILYPVIFTASYYGLLRVSEVAAETHPILVHDAHIAINKKKILFILRTSKTHCKSSRLQEVKITSSANGSNVTPHLCPFRILQNCIKVCKPAKSKSETFFAYYDRSPVQAASIHRVLKKSLVRCSFDPTHYSLHSLRSGRVGDLLKMGVSVENIKKLGRWKSNAVFNYLC